MTKALHEFTNKELAALHRDYPRGDHPTYRTDLGAEVARRRALRTERRALAAIVIAALAAFFSMAAAIASWVAVAMKLG